MTFEGCNVAMNLDPPGASDSDPVGSVYLLDVQFLDCGTLIYTFPFRSSETGTTVFTFDNLYFRGNSQFMTFTDGSGVVLDVNSEGNMDFATIGDLQADGTPLDGFYAVNFGTRNAALTEADSGYDAAQNGYVRRP